MTLVLLFISGVLFAFAGVSTLCAVGWKRKSDDAIKSANYNAALWAKSEAERHDLEIENARLKGQHSESLRAFVAMSRVASEAIKASAINNGLPAPVLLEAVEPHDALLPPEDDSILNAQDVG